MSDDATLASRMTFDRIQLWYKSQAEYQKELEKNRVPPPDGSDEELLAQHKVLAVSFYTPDYKKAAERLAGTLDSFSIPHDLVPIEGSGGDRAWYDALMQKALFLLKMLDKHPDYETLVWLDSDGEMIRFPRLVWNIPAVIGVHYQSFKMPMDATVVVHQSSREVLKRWAEESQIALDKGWNCPSQNALKVVLEQDRIEWIQLPRSYSVLWRWATGRPVDWAIFIHERWGRNSKIPTRNKGVR